MIRWRRFAVMMLALMIWGCNDEDSRGGTGYRGPVNSCKKNGDCPRQSTCNKDLGLCVSDTSLEGRILYAKIYPRNGVPRVHRLDFNEKRTVSIPLAPAVPVPFRVWTRTSTSEYPSSLNADIFIEDTVALPGETGTVVTTGVTQLVKDAVVKLWPGEGRYNIRIIPKDITSSAPPPLYLDNVTVALNDDCLETGESDTDFEPSDTEGDGAEADTETDRPGEDTTSADTDTETNTAKNDIGCLMDKDGEVLSTITLISQQYTLEGALFRGPQPLSGYRVVAFDLESGRILSNTAETRCATTGDGSLCGEFSIALSVETDTPENSAKPYGLRVTRPSDPFFPETEVLSSIGEPGEGGRVVYRLDPLSGPVRFEGRVEGRVQLESGSVVHNGVENCLVVIEGVQTGDGMETHMRLNALTDHAGNIKGVSEEPAVYLYPGQYSLSIIPPSPGRNDYVSYGVYMDERTVDAETTGSANEVFLLPYRTRVLGRVVLGDAAIPEARLSAEPLNHLFPYPVRQHSSPFGDNALGMWLDSGAYRLTAAVPYSSALAYSISRVDIDLPVGDAPIPNEVVLDDIAPSPPVVARLALSSESVSVGRIRVEWYEVQDGVSVLIGKSLSDEDGTVVGLLPPSISNGGEETQ